ncbi:MAG TPA: RsbRD N-terminal domain-containing protein, partial [Blastocatellia bacterium]|nr:RsbRD N-terminal domain-containing protein [Blastocatellia bacterium]
MESTTTARKIRANLDHLIKSWTMQVRADPRIKSDAGLNQPELIDHVPAIIDEICQLLENGEIPSVRNTVEARANVYTRINQGYRARDLVRELSLLRIILIDYVEEIHADRSLGIGSAERQGASRTINL